MSPKSSLPQDAKSVSVALTPDKSNGQGLPSRIDLGLLAARPRNARAMKARQFVSIRRRALPIHENSRQIRGFHVLRIQLLEGHNDFRLRIVLMGLVVRELPMPRLFAQCV